LRYQRFGRPRALANEARKEGVMLKLHIERIGDVAVIQCEGRIVQSDATIKLRDTVRQQRDARVIMLDLSDVESLGGSGLGMLLFLERWTSERGIQFKIVDPPDRVRQSLERARSAVAVETAGMVEVLSLLGWYDQAMTSEVGTNLG
jgi:anti-anti-sigma factor